MAQQLSFHQGTNYATIFFVLKIIEFIGQRNFAMARAKLNDEVIYVT
jgi:hypothetical protein